MKNDEAKRSNIWMLFIFDVIEIESNANNNENIESK